MKQIITNLSWKSYRHQRHESEKRKNSCPSSLSWKSNRHQCHESEKLKMRAPHLYLAKVITTNAAKAKNTKLMPLIFPLRPFGGILIAQQKKEDRDEESISD